MSQKAALPLRGRVANMRSKIQPMRVFLSIASYCDPVLGFTLARAIATARHPDRLHFGIVDQSPAAAPAPLAADVAPARLSLVRLEPLYARGPCWARAIAMSLYDGEEWFFQIDSHMDFDPGWDDYLILLATVLLLGQTLTVYKCMYPVT
ncbi:MAG: hypothetical protein EON54_27450 [Alcaligenaceae bacterium]|nr:MAG: hypothetical protein EON54_27450 [Alcaligenaceae bacterium]